MKRAFDNNLPRVKPRVRFGSDASELGDAPTEGVHRNGSVGSSVDAQRLAQQVLRSPLSSNESVEVAEVEEAPVVEERPVARISEPPPDLRQEISSRIGADTSAQRREKLRARLRNLTPPGNAARSSGNPEAVLAAAEDLVQQLADSRATSSRLEADLKSARRDLERSVADAEQGRREGESLAAELAEARGLLGSLESELGAIEGERDEVLFEVHQLREAESARSESLASLSRELDEARRELVEKQSEQAEILSELQQSDAERARLQLEVERLEQDRKRTLQELEATSVAEGQLREQRGTLSRVHQVLVAARKS
jgi:chromosome segregation ATPase